MYSMPRSVRASRKLRETSFVIGTGAAIGPATRISTSSRRPRSTRWSWSKRAPSNGAGGHLKRMAEDPDQDPPRVDFRENVAHPLRPRDRVVLDASLFEPGRGGEVVRRP